VLPPPQTSPPHPIPLSRAAATFAAGANQILLARQTKFGWRWRETFPGGGGGIRRDLMNGGTSHY